MSDLKGDVPFGKAIEIAVAGLKSHPPLLGAVAIGILIAVVAIVAGDAVGAVAMPLLAVLVAGLLAWVYTDARRAQQGKPGVFQNTRLGRNSRVEGVIRKTGHVEPPTSGRVEQNFEVGPGATVKDSTFEHGDVGSRH